MMRTIKKEHTLDTRTIGSLEVSIVGLGCKIGWRMNYEATAAVVHAALDAGITFFDTAGASYGGTRSEEYLGCALGPRRTISSWRRSRHGGGDDRRRGARPEYIRQAAEDSYAASERTTLISINSTSPTPRCLLRIRSAAGRTLRAGKVREIGCSNFPLSRFDKRPKPFLKAQPGSSVCRRVRSFAAGSRTKTCYQCEVRRLLQFHSSTGKRPPHGKVLTGSITT